MREPLLLYSTVTWLAYAIAERFYGGVHYAWCSPYYDGATAERHVNIPPTASPAEIYRTLCEEARRDDRHSSAMREKGDGIVRGAEARRDAGMITESLRLHIRGVVAASHAGDYRPLLYVIPYDRVRGMAREATVDEKAHPLSLEYRIDALPRECFDVLELRS